MFFEREWNYDSNSCSLKLLRERSEDESSGKHTDYSTKPNADLGSFQQWAITWGILIQYFIQYGAAEGTGGGPNDPNQPTAAFRIPWGVQMIPAFILFVGLFFFPYSPRWLASQDRWEEALQVLAKLHGKGDQNDPKVLAQYREIEDALRFDREEATSSLSALIQPRMLKRVVLGMSIQMWSQLCGMNIMMCKLNC